MSFDQVLQLTLAAILIILLYYIARKDREKERNITVLQEEVLRSSLTGMYNEHYWVQHAAEIIKKMRGEKSVIFIDADNFKEINDRFGHHVGDSAIRKIADALKVRPDELAVHLHGDEFLLLIHGGEKEANQIMERVDRSLAAEKSLLRVQTEKGSPEVIRLRVTYGIAVATDEVKKSPPELYIEANASMRASKQAKGVER